MKNDLFSGFGLKVELTSPNNFLKIVETLTRMGVGSKSKKKLWQTCHLLHKRDSQGKSHYAIMHFKEMFGLDGKRCDTDEIDIERRNRIAFNLEQWGLLTIIDQDIDSNEDLECNYLIIPFKEKSEYELIPMYTMWKQLKKE